MKTVIIILIVSLGAYSQQGKGKYFRASLGFGISSSNAHVYNELWLRNAPKNSKKLGDNYYGELNFKLFKGLWLGFGLNVYNRIYNYQQVDANNLNTPPTSISNEFYGIEYNFKAEYLYFLKNNKTFVSALIRPKLSVVFKQKKTFIGANGLANTYIYYPDYGFTNITNRLEFGGSIGQTFGSKNQYIFSIEPTYSFYSRSGKKVDTIDKINVNTFNLNFMLTWYPQIRKPTIKKKIRI